MHDEPGCVLAPLSSTIAAYDCVSGSPHSSLGATHGSQWQAGAPDNEAEDVEEEEDVQRKSVVYLLWVGAGISARPRGLRPFGSRSVVGELPAKSRGDSRLDLSQY